jgi:tRNA A37 threonylcarbamoyladenosine dehydratase
MNAETDIQSQIQSAIENERKSHKKSESKRALIGVFVVIPAVALFVVAGWFVLRIVQGG